MNQNSFSILKICLSIIAFATTGLFAQDSFTYIGLHDNAAGKKVLLDATRKRYESDVAALAGNNKKYIADVYKERFASVEKYYTDSTVIVDANATQYLQSVMGEIISKNPQLKSVDMRILFSRSYWPNAFSAGEGTILFNIGLFSRLQNEAQAAFVLCHELSHQYLNHSNLHIQNYINTIYSDTFQRRLQQIKKTEYGKRQMLEEMITGISFSDHRHGREHEAEADSMALEFLKNTQYNVNSAISCLALLDSVDNDKYNVLPKPDSFFNNTSYPFQPAWIKRDNGFFSKLAASTIEENKLKADSLKTHPDCDLRIQYLQPQAEKYFRSDSKDFIVKDSLAFIQLQKTFDFEIVNYNYQNGNLSRSLYYSLQMLQTYPGNAFLVTNVGRCFNKMYDAQKNHVLGKIADAPSPTAEKKYNDFLQFLQKLRLADIAGINYNFLKSYSGALASDTAFQTTFYKQRSAV